MFRQEEGNFPFGFGPRSLSGLLGRMPFPLPIPVVGKDGLLMNELFAAEIKRQIAALGVGLDPVNQRWVIHGAPRWLKNFVDPLSACVSFMVPAEAVNDEKAKALLVAQVNELILMGRVEPKVGNNLPDGVYVVKQSSAVNDNFDESLKGMISRIKGSYETTAFAVLVGEITTSGFFDFKDVVAVGDVVLVEDGVVTKNLSTKFFASLKARLTSFFNPFGSCKSDGVDGRLWSVSRNSSNKTGIVFNGEGRANDGRKVAWEMVVAYPKDLSADLMVRVSLTKTCGGQVKDQGFDCRLGGKVIDEIKLLHQQGESYDLDSEELIDLFKLVKSWLEAE